MAATLDEIQIKISQDSKSASKSIDALINSLEKLGKVSDLSSVASNIASLSESLGNLKGVADGFNIGDVAKELRKIPKAIASFNDMPMEDVQKFSTLVQTITDIASPLAKEMQTLSGSFKDFVSSTKLVSSTLAPIPQVAENAKKKLKDLNEEAEKSKNSFVKATEGFTKFALKGTAIYAIAKYIKNAAANTTKYMQTMNMAQVVMGSASAKAEELADKLENVFGLNKAEVMEFQSTFQSLFVSFGNTSKNAQIMGQNLTQLSYDMAAFYTQLGGDPGAGMEKLRLAMAGTIEPLQRLGYALKEADLKAVAARQGLNVNVRNLNSASKSMLRYIAVMEQSERVQGAWGRTIDSPATALMSLKQSLNNISIEIGKTFLPVIMAAIPYLQALVRGVLNMVETINSMLGIELPKIEGWDKAQEGMAGLGDEAEETGKSIKKAFTMGIDELNVFDSSTSSATDGIQDITGLLKLPKYDMTEGFDSKKLEEIQEKLAPLEGLFNGIAEAIAGFIKGIKDFSDTTLYPWLVNMGDWMEDHPGVMEEIGKGLATVALGFLAIKAVGALANILGIPELIKGLTSAYNWLSDNKILALRLAAAGLAIYGAFLLIKSIVDIINGEGEFGENIRKGLAGIYFLLVSYIAGVAIPLVINDFAKFGESAGIVFKGMSKAGTLAMLGIAAVAGLALGYILLNWDDASYNIQQTIGKLMIWLEDKLIQIPIKISEILGEVQKALISAKYAIMKGVAKLYGWILQNWGKLIDKAAESASKSLGTIDSILGTDLQKKFDANYKSLEDTAKGFQDDILKGLDNAEIEAKADVDYNVKLNKEDWEAIGEDVKSYWKDYLATSQKMYDEAKAEKKAKEDERNKENEEELKKSAEKVQSEVEKATQGAAIDVPNIEIPGLDLTLTEDKLSEMVNKQIEANDAQTTANQAQAQFNTDSLANDKSLQETMEAAKKLISTDTTEVTKQISTDASSIISAIQKVEAACKDIKINVHYHTSGGGGDGYATGGTPRRGDYFYAREDGMPEMVGRVGRQTTVMNNGQIADTMAESMIRAMSQNEVASEPTVIESKLYLDGEVVYTNQEKIKRSKGYSFGLGAFANV